MQARPLNVLYTCFVLGILTILLAPAKLKAQDFSNKGTDFWVAYTGHIDGTNSRMALYITSDQDASGVVDINGSTINFNVAANQATTIRLTNITNPSNTVAYNSQIEGIGSKRGIHITSSKPVVVYAHILNAARSGSSLVIPTNTLGKQYYVASYKSIGTNQVRRTLFAVVATVDNTTIEVTPTQADASRIHAANVPFTVKLSKGDVYQYQSDEDLTGSYIQSIGDGTSACQPIAVFSGSTWTAMGCTNGTSGDNLYQQIFPFATWGKTYYTAPFQFRSFDIFRILVQDPTSVVKVNGAALPVSALVNGRFYEINTMGNNTARVITSDKPICVFQYMVSQGCDGVNSDPEMIILNSVEQTLNDITVMSARNDLTPPNTNISNHYLNIIFKTNTFSSLKVDGKAPAAIPIAIAGTNYSYIKEDVTASTAINPSHHIVSDSGFICLAYGYGNVESYGYNAGTNVKDLYQFVTLQNQFATVNFPATCSKTPFFFAITLPYLAKSLVWDFANAPSLSPNAGVINNSPVPDSSFVRDGRTLFVYKLPAEYSFSTPGTYPIKVTANNPTPDGCSGIQEINYNVEVFKAPVADFTSTNTGCLQDTIQFKEIGNGNGRPITGWVWNFGDQSADIIKAPAKLYSTAGDYPVHLRVITDVGCVADTTKFFRISSEPVAHFRVSDTACSGQNVTFFDSSYIADGSIVQWKWDFGNGTTVVNATGTAVNQTYAAPGTYTVTLTVVSNTGCTSVTFSKQVTVQPLPFVDFSLPNVCLPSGIARFQNLSVLNNSTALSYHWNFGDGSTDTARMPVHRYAATGPFTVQLQATSPKGCTKDTTKLISNIFSQAKAGFSIPPEVCLRDTTRFNDRSTGNGNSVVQWRWDFGDGAIDTAQHPAHRYANPGTYTVKLFGITDKGCSTDTISQTTIVNALPVAVFSVSQPACETKQLIFKDGSTPGAGIVTGWYYGFGDGTNATYSSGSPFAKTYAAHGTYQVKTALINSKGCKSDTLTSPVVIHPQPVAAFVLPEVCLTDAFAQFADSSFVTGVANSSFTYRWTFGDPNANAANPDTSLVKNPRHLYSSVGNYTVSLAVTTPQGCTASLSKAFTVNGDKPFADFEVLNAGTLCSNTTVQLKNNATVNFGSITRVQIIWDALGAPAAIFTDEAPTQGKIYSHLYPDFQTPASKTYQVKFIAYSGATCVDTRTKQVTVQASPRVGFGVLPGICLEAAPRQITQVSETSGLPGQGIFYGAGISAVGVVNPAGAGAGTNPVKYVYVLNNGCRDSATNNLTVWPSPVAKWGTSAPLCATNSILFSDSSQAGFSQIQHWNWTFGDGTVANATSAAPIPKVFTAAGSFPVTLQVITDSGCRSMPVTKTVQVHPLPQVDFSLPVVCLPAGKAPFINRSVIADSSMAAFKYKWTFGDLNNTLTSLLQHPVHTYTGLGPYPVKLIVTTGSGCIDSVTKQLTTIYPQPKAAFAGNAQQVCIGETFTFTDQSNGLSGPVTQWQWNFGDGGVSATQNNTKRFTTPGTYSVSLAITNQLGCVSDTAVNTFIVHPFPVVNAGADLVILEGGSATLKATATGNDLGFRWTPAIYLNNDQVQNPVVSPTADITYLLTVTARGGCTASDNVFVQVLKTPAVPNVFSPNNDGINDTWVIRYLETYPGATVDVFNRTGQPVFSSIGYDTPWNGTFKGAALPVGTYYYIINPKNGRKPMSGSVTLLR